MMLATHTYHPPWAAIGTFILGVGWAMVIGFVLALIWMMLGSIADTRGWRVPPPVRWLADLICAVWFLGARLVGRRGRHAGGWIGPIRRNVAFATGRSSGATPTTSLPKFLPEPVEPGPDSPLGGEVKGTDPEPTDEPDPLLDEGAYRTGMTFAFPKAAAIIHEARAKAAAQ